MNALRDPHVQLWVIVLLVAAALIGGAFVGMRAGEPTVVYDYTVELAGSVHEPLTLEYGVWPALARADFFDLVRTQFIEQKASFVEANLTAMQLSVYREGVPVLTVPIKSKGREGSWWETPAGLYKAQGKEESHFSSFGQVYMPYSIPFQGNFFIHGWPYHPDGTPVPEGYSGGCIRLEDQYASQVYAEVKVGMPILVYEESREEYAYTYELDAPNVSTGKYLVADLDTNFVLLGNGAGLSAHTQVLPKLMAALVSSEYQNIEKLLNVPSGAGNGVTRGSVLVPGATYSIYDLFFPLLRAGDPGAARALSAYFGERRFVALQNEKAAALGMGGTTFVDAAGESAENRTTAEDMFLFLKYLVSNRSFILAVSAGTVNLATYGESVFSAASSSHPLVELEGFVGGLADVPSVPLADAGVEGPQSASVALAFARSNDAPTDGDDLVSVVKMPFGDGVSRTLALIVLDSQDPGADARAMLAHVEKLYR